MSGHGAQDDRRCSVRQNRVVLASVADVKLPVANWIQPDRSAIKPAAMEAKGIRLQGELGISRQTIAQGMPACSGCTCMLVCALPRAHCTRDRGCSKHPAFPAPSRLRERKFSKPRAPRAARTPTHIQLSSPEGGRSSIPETAVMESIRRGVLDARLRGHDSTLRVVLITPYSQGADLPTPPALHHCSRWRGLREIPAPVRRPQGSGSAS